MQYEKLHFPILITIIALCKRALRRLMLDVWQTAGDGGDEAGDERVQGCPPPGAVPPDTAS